MRRMVRQWQRVPVHHRNENRGFTLLEVLVSLLVLSIGLIGVAGLQLLGVSNSRDAYFRTQAVMLSYDISDRMRANLDAVEDGDYDKNVNTTLKSSCRQASGCSTSDMADDDTALWLDRVNDLPLGAGIVCVDSDIDDDTAVAATADCDGSGNQYVVKIWWDQDRSGAIDADNERLVTVFVP